MDPSNFRLPAEWERQSALLLAWPSENGPWQSVLESIQAEYIELIAAVLRYQAVVLLVQPGSGDARRKLGNQAGLKYLEAPYNDTWCRDYGPITLTHAGKRLAIDFYFNGWGGKHEASLDNRVNTHLSRNELFADLAFRQSLLEFEGGAIESNGRGLILINRHCMRTRLSHLTDAEVDQELMTWLGADRILEIDVPPLAGDDTDGHIDTLARFVRENAIVFQSRRSDADTRALTGQLEALRDLSGRPFELFALPCPSDLDPALATSYANFILINHAVLVPRFGSREDDRALAIIAEQFPDRTTESVDARVLVSQAGGPHCASMQIPTALA